MKSKASITDNKTGSENRPAQTAAMRGAVAEFPPSSTGSRVAADAVRIDYARKVPADDLGLGSVPGPGPALLFDKLGERLAFERSGVRLYQAMISKLEAFGEYPGGPTRDELLEILNEEHCHAAMLEEAIERLDGDPTAVTPAADVAANIGKGVVQVVTDPRTTVVQSLDAMLVAELADGAGWGALIDIVRKAGHEDLAKAFTLAEQTEAQHRVKVMSWLAASRQ
jgi:rubrerythrin